MNPTFHDVAPPIAVDVSVKLTPLTAVAAVKVTDVVPELTGRAVVSSELETVKPVENVCAEGFTKFPESVKLSEAACAVHPAGIVIFTV